jgi:hypothetical protein
MPRHHVLYGQWLRQDGRGADARRELTAGNAREVLAILDEYGSIRGYLASFPDAAAAAADIGGALSCSATRGCGGC